MIDLCEGKGWKILNGNVRGDREGEFTFIGARGSTVIDYVIVNDEVWDEDIAFAIQERIDSDHVPLVLEITMENLGREDLGIEDKRKKNKERNEKEDTRRVLVWNEESIKQYAKKTKELCEKIEEKKEDSTEIRWKDTKDIIEKSWTKEERKIRKKGIGYKAWWSRECSRLKRKAKRAYKDWRLDKGDKTQYIAFRKEWRDKCRESKKEWKECISG